MSAIPSNTDQFLGGLAAGTQALGLASQNQRAKMDFALAQQQMGLERQKMAQQGQQFEQGLQAEAANYEKLNQSRERMAQSEMAQQQGQFEATMGFNREQAKLERLVSLKMKQLDMDLVRNEQEIAAMADNDPRLQELRQKRRTTQTSLANLEELIVGNELAMGLAQRVRSDRLAEVTARMNQFQEAIKERRSLADQAMMAGYQYATTKDSLDGGIFNEVSRLMESEEMAQARGLQQGAEGPFGSTVRIALDEVQKFFTGQGDEELAKRKASQFLQNGGAMATSIVHSALNLNGDAFGLQGPEKAAAVAAATEAVTYAGVLAGMDPRVRGVDQGQTRQRIASNIAKMRQAGMGDEQIMALFDGLETVSQNRQNAIMEYQASGGGDAEAKMLDQALTGVGTVQDMIEGVVNDKELMRRVGGGAMADFSKRDMGAVVRKAQLAYGMGESAELQNLVQEMDALGMSDAEIQQISTRLIEADPRLQFLRPEQYGEMLRGLARQKVEAGLGAVDTEEALRQTQGQVVAEGRLQGLNEADRRLAELAGFIGG